MYFHLMIFSIFLLPHSEIISKAEENPSADDKGQVQSNVGQTVGNYENSDGRIGELIQKFPFLEKASSTAIDEFDEILNDTNLTKSELDNRRLEWAKKQNNADVEIAYQKWKEQIEVGKHEAFMRIESKFGLFAKMRKLYRKIKKIILDRGITREQECQRIQDILIGSDIDANLREEFLQQINIQLVEFCLHQKLIEHISGKPQDKSENSWPHLSMEMPNSTRPMIGPALNKMASEVPSSSSSSSSSENLDEEEKGKRRKEREEEEDSDEKRKKRKKEKKAKRKREMEERKERKKKREEKPKEIKEEKRDESVMKDEDGSNNLSNSNSSSSSSEEDGNMEKANKNHDRKKIRNKEEEEQKEGSTSSSSSQSSSQSSEEGKDEVDQMEKLLKEKAKKLKKKKNHHQNEEDEDMDSSENSDETSKNARHWAISKEN